jgi:hypothetical protein
MQKLKNRILTKTFSAQDAFLVKPSSDTLKIERLESQII